MELGDRHLRVQRASIGVTQASGLEMGVNAMSMLAGTTSNDLEEGRVLQLLNMVTPEELIDNEDYAGTYCFPQLITIKLSLCQYSFVQGLVAFTDVCETQKSAKIFRKSARSTAR